MQKIFFTVIILFIFCYAYGQDEILHVPKFHLQSNKIVYYDTVFVDTTTNSHQQLLENVHEWYSHTYETSDDRLLIDNSDAGLISGTGTVNFKKHKGDYRDLLFTIDILIGNGFYTYKIYNLYGYDNGTKFYYSDMYSEELYPTPKPRWPKTISTYKLYNVDVSVNEIIANLKSGIIKKWR
ncbi:MAG: hypothetical protein P4L41_10680 [Flavipsychrobacter sp.]|nr:hypothetical protein [Flavipsychrobacter sp.]